VQPQPRSLRIAWAISVMHSVSALPSKDARPMEIALLSRWLGRPLDKSTMTKLKVRLWGPVDRFGNGRYQSRGCIGIRE
jgi:hypothetical protein